MRASLALLHLVEVGYNEPGVVAFIYLMASAMPLRCACGDRMTYLRAWTLKMFYQFFSTPQ
jgi:hypothetical protein